MFTTLSLAERVLLLLACLVGLSAAAHAQSSCPRVWVRGDTLWTDPADAYQWFRGTEAIQGANRQYFVPNDRQPASYRVEAFGLNAAYSVGGGERVRYRIRAQVFGPDYQPVANARVRVLGREQTTDAQGVALIDVETAAGGRVAVQAQHADYLDQASAHIAPSRSATQYAYLRLVPRRTTHRLDAQRGGTASQPGFWLSLPPNAVVDEATGAPYTGEIQLQVESARPSDGDFGLRMPGGDFMARDRNGRPVILYSYGFVGVELRGSAGQRLNLGPNQRAQLRFQIEGGQRADAPAQVPLWHFDESQSLWTYGGEFVREGLLYTGEVSHFSWWNCDYRGPRATVKGRLVSCSGEPLPGLQVPFGQWNAVSDENGDFEVWVGAGQRFELNDFRTAQPRGSFLGPFAANETSTLEEPITITSMVSTRATYVEFELGQPNRLYTSALFNRNFTSFSYTVSLDNGASYQRADGISLRRDELPEFVWFKDEAGCFLKSKPQVAVVDGNCVYVRGQFDESRFVYTVDQLIQGWRISDEIFGSYTDISLDIETLERESGMKQLQTYAPCLSSVTINVYSWQNPQELTNLEDLMLPLSLRKIEIRGRSVSPDSISRVRLPVQLNELSQLERFWGNAFVPEIYPSDWSHFTALEDIRLTNMSELNNWLVVLSTVPGLKRLTLGYTWRNPTETLNIPDEFADLADTLEELNMAGCNITDPAQRQRIQNLLPNTSIQF